jgi:hypothetical protein
MDKYADLPMDLADASLVVLRGPANGARERRRIVTVLDNLGRFGKRQPFDFCSKFYGAG